MGTTSGIEWTNSTGSPWLGCTEVSPGCANCYARLLAETRLAPIFRKAYRKAGLKNWEGMPVWGNKSPRVLTRGFWTHASAFDRKATKTGIRIRMFPSLDDWLDDMPAGIIDQDGNRLDPITVVADLLKLIRTTPNLDWQLLTKRPADWSGRLHAAKRSIHDGTDEWIGQWLDGEAPPNVWIGTTVEDQKHANQRIPKLLTIPARVRFLSCEPLLGPINLLTAVDSVRDITLGSGVHWVIVGGESGSKARPMHPEWARRLRDTCELHGVAFFFKQWGSWKPCGHQGQHAPAEYVFPDGAAMVGVSKHSAGRMLDGKEWSQFPA